MNVSKCYDFTVLVFYRRDFLNYFLPDFINFYKSINSTFIIYTANEILQHLLV